MKKKLFILIGFLLLLTGCTAEVNITLSDEKVHEIITIDSYPTGEITTDIIKNGFRKNVPAYNKVLLIDSEEDKPKSGVSYYKYSMTELGNNGYRTTYKFDFPFSYYDDARSLKQSYVTSMIDNTGDKFVIKTDTVNQNFYLYPELDKLVINIDSKYPVVDSNADICNNNKCTWTITRSNYTNKEIYIKINKSKSNNNDTKKEDQKEDNKEEKQEDKKEDEKEEQYKPAEEKDSDKDNMINYNEESYNTTEEEEEKNYTFLVIIGLLVVFLIIISIIGKKRK